jgi:predicted transcriptional regulator
LRLTSYKIEGIYEEWQQGNIDSETAWAYYQHQSEFLGSKNDPYPSLEKRKNLQIVQNILSELKNSTLLEEQKYTTQKTVQNSPLIFLSHRSSDKKYGDALRDIIAGLGVKNKQLIYTSHQFHKIPTDMNIYEFLRENLSESVYVIFILSNEYFDSSACLNEMGAAWLAQKDYTNIFTPDFNFMNAKYRECVIDKDKMGIILNGDKICKSRMIDFKNNIIKLFNLQIDEQSWIDLLDKFIDTIGSINTQSGEVSRDRNDHNNRTNKKSVSVQIPDNGIVLSDDAKELLKEISLDTSGILGIVETLGSYEVQTNDKIFGCEHSDARARATIDSAIEELENTGCIKTIDDKREMFRITNRGYKIADSI